jgi:hypothetical protein
MIMNWRTLHGETRCLSSFVINFYMRRWDCLVIVLINTSCFLSISLGVRSSPPTLYIFFFLLKYIIIRYRHEMELSTSADIVGMSIDFFFFWAHIILFQHLNAPNLGYKQVLPSSAMSIHFLMPKSF